MQFVKPLYDGDQVTVSGTITAVTETSLGLDIVGSNAAGMICGSGTAQFPSSQERPPDPTAVPVGAAPDATTYRPCRIGEALEIRAVPVHKFEKKGHEFVVLDVLLLAAGAVAQRVKYTCIFRPRQSRRTEG